MLELRSGLHKTEMIEKDKDAMIFSGSSISLSSCKIWTVTAVNDTEILEIGSV